MTTTAYDTLASLLHARHSCRAFLPTPLARETIAQILTAAQRTASWCNAQPWQVHVVGGAPLEALRARLQQAAANDAPQPDIAWPAAYRGVYQERRRTCGWGLYEAVGIAKGDRAASERQGAENFRLFGAPHLAIVTSEAALGTYGVLDCGAYVGQFLLAAQALGVGAIAQAALAAYPGVLREALGIADERTIVCGVSFGLADTAHPANGFRTERAPLAEAVTWVE